jgi:hypothetical protein
VNPAPIDAATAQPVHMTPCEALTAEHRAVQVPAPPPDEPPVVRVPEHVGECFPVAGGAWAIVLERGESEGSPVFRWSVRWRGDDGATASLIPELASPHCGEGAQGCNLPSIGLVTLDAPRVTDLDGDGRMEFYVGAVHEAEEGIYSDSRAFYTLRNGSIAAVELPLPTGTSLDGVDDVDHDGRLDLLSHGPYTGSDTSSCSGFPTRMTGPLLLAHSLASGGWSWTDEVARTFARRACPRAPRALSNAQDVVCARLWGWDAARTRRSIRCRAPRQSDSCDQPPRDVCGDYDVRAAWAAATPPLSLAAPAPATPAPATPALH